MPLPEGTIAFLFTDIEGSTQLWDRYPEAMSPALARHDALMREAIAAQNGHVFKTIGDAFCAAFWTVPDAVLAAVRIQRKLVREQWALPTPLRVRMAIHAGAAEARDSDYFGPALNRVARLLSLGHGGQVLLSRTAFDLARDHTFDGVTMTDLGEFPLRDLSRPEQVFQISHPDLPADFPPLRSLNHSDSPNNLPQQVTSFIGREAEIASVHNLLKRTRLLTLTGSGGVGKTRLSLQVAAELLEQNPDGVWQVELARLTESAQVPRALAAALNVREESGVPLIETLLESLRAKKTVLLFDNCEHLIEASARLADSILRSCPYVKILATSREPLNTSGEQTFRVPSLSLPDARAATDSARLSQYESVRLFIDRAVQVRPDFAVTNANAPALASLCSRLDGIPLAIELAAARVRSLGVDEIEGRLSDAFRILTGGSRTALPRQQTIRATIDWSHQLLTASEKKLLRRLAVFAGSWSLDAAEAVCADGPDADTDSPLADWEILDLLGGLADKSLVALEDEREGGGMRYRLLETVRQYALEKLSADSETAPIEERHARWCLALAEDAAAGLQGAEQATWMARLETEYPNLRAALAWCIRQQRTDEGMRLARSLRRFWGIRGYWSDGLSYLAPILALPGAEAATQARADVLNTAGVMAMLLGEFPVARERLLESRDIARRLGDGSGISSALLNLGNIAGARGEYEQALAYYEEGIETDRQTGNRANEARNRQMRGRTLSDLGRYDDARADLERALAIHREIGDRFAEAVVLDNLAALQVRLVGTAGEQSSPGGSDRGDYREARRLYDAALALAREIGYQEEELCWLSGMGAIARREGEMARAAEFYRQVLDEAVRLGGKGNIGVTLEGLAGVETASGNFARAARLYGFEAALRERIGYHFAPIDGRQYDTDLAAVRAALGDDAFQTQWSVGQAMTLEEAVRFALDPS